jgi:hypothetical protein
MADRYWVGGTGSWDASTTAHWSTSSGGSGGASVPTSTDNVIFDNLSNTAGYTVTITAIATCLDFTMGAPASGNVTWAGSYALNIYGSLNLSGGTSGITSTYSGTLTFRSTLTGKTVGLNGIVAGWQTYFNGVGGGWTLLDTWNSGDYSINLDNGSLNTNGVTMTLGNFASNNTNIRTLILGASAITLGSYGQWSVTSTNLTFDAGASTITMNGSGEQFGGVGGLAYNNVILNQSFTSTVVTMLRGTNTFANLTRIGTAITNDAFVIGGNQTITGTCTMTGNSATNTLAVCSDSPGLQRTITAAHFVIDKCSFKDIVCAGAGAPAVPIITASDLGNNSGITFTYGRYWVGGTGNWSNGANHWALTSGGAAGQIAPNLYDNTYFNANSGAGTVTVDVISNTLDLNFTGYTGTFAGTAGLSIYGSLLMSSGMTSPTYSGTIIFASTTTGKTITFAGKTLQVSVTFDGEGGEWTFQDNILVGNNKYISLTRGTLYTNGKTVGGGNIGFYSTGSFTRSLYLGSSNVTVNSWYVSNSLNLNAETSTITMTGGAYYFLGGGLTYYNMVAPAASGSRSIGDGTFNNITIASAQKTGILGINNNITVNGTLSITGNSSVNRPFIYSSNSSGNPVLGTARTITAAAVSITSTDFQDITAAGAANWDLSAITGGSGNCGGNIGITFTPATTWYYYTSASDNWSTIGKWYTGPGGTGTQSTYPPLPQDVARFDSLSFTAGGITITQDMPRIGSVDWTGATNTPTWTTSTICSVYGSITLIAGMVLTNSTQAYTFAGRGSYTLDSAVSTWAKSLTINMATGTLTLKSDLSDNLTSDILTVTSGTLTCIDGINNYNITFATISVGTNGNLTLGTGTHTIFRGAGTPFNIVGNINAGTSTIKVTGGTTSVITIAGGSRTFYNLWINSTTSNYHVITGSNTFNDFKIAAGRTVKFTDSTTTTVNTFTADGSTGLITISNTSETVTTPATLVKAGGGTISGCDFIDARYLIGSPAYTWYIGPNSTITSSTNIYPTAVVPPNITATSMTATPSETPCRIGICTVTVNVIWTNNGGSAGTFYPNITIDGTPITPAPFPLSDPLLVGGTVSHTFIVHDLAAGTRAICPYPN